MHSGNIPLLLGGKNSPTKANKTFLKVNRETGTMKSKCRYFFTCCNINLINWNILEGDIKCLVNNDQG